jgi:hypothetical protein
MPLPAPGPAAEAPSKPTVNFNRQILPILSDNCFACHGPDAGQRKAKLRLDTKEGAFAEMREGGHSIVAGKSAESGIIQRATTSDASKLMPPPKSGKKLTPAQIALLKQWIDEGANWSPHWAFVPEKPSAVPAVKDQRWPKNPIDFFILSRLEKEGLQPSPEADRHTLIRRVTFDLTGLPPTPAEVKAFVEDPSPEAYDKLVERLLGSPRYGEHMARYWLDVARYGDTHGLHLDNYREMWPYRDWVVSAFNNNMPFDRFVIEQLAGDMLPNATLEQTIASGFNRCHVTTSEGGSIEEEVYVRNVVDRIDTTGTVFLGLSTGCARCHDHKYDPLTMKDYYQLFAIFNSLDEGALDGNAAVYPPVTRVAGPEQLAAIEKLKQKTAELKKRIADEAAKIKYEEPATVVQTGKEPGERAEYVWIDDELPAGAKPSSDGGVNGRWDFVSAPQPVFSGTRSVKRSANGLSQHYFEGAQPGLKVGAGDTLFAHVYLDPAKPPKEIMLQWHTGQWQHRAYWGENVIPWGTDNSGERRRLGPLPEKGKWVRLEVPVDQVGLKVGAVIQGWAFTQHDGTVYWDKAGIVSRTPQGAGSRHFESLAAWLKLQQKTGGTGLPRDLQRLVKLPAEKRTEPQQKQLRDYFLENAYTKAQATFAPLHEQLKVIEKEREALEKKFPTTLVSRERSEPRAAYILKRGEYDRRGDQVKRGMPAFLPPPAPGLPMNRLGFAQWLVTSENPLAARVAVNRFWQHCFGTGLVKTSEDFGAQGEPPSHPELLDWLALQFREDRWDVKHMMKRIVTSATYRQSARVTKDRLAKDPGNRLLARGPRFRLDAEMLRDQGLFISGLMVEKRGGPSVKPPQPAGLWEAVGYVTSNTRNFVADSGPEKVYRRSLYTFWKRTAPPPQMTAFDAPSREACMVRRERTNTPLQALLLLNEKQYFECARALARRAVKEGGATPEARVAFMFELATCRKPDARETAELLSAFRDFKEKYQRETEAAAKVIGDAKPDAELAAWTMIANLILNLDEVVNKG